jgi:hypothetical protein
MCETETIIRFFIYFILRCKIEFSIQTPMRVGTKIKFRSLRWEPYKNSLTIKKKTEVKDMDQPATKMLSLDFARYYLSVMKLNSCTKKNTQTIKDK